MALSLGSEWRKLPLTLAELCIDTALRCGQSFRWQQIDDKWICTLRGRVVSLKQDPHHLHYKVTWPATKFQKKPSGSLLPGEDDDDTEALLRHYLSLSLDLPALYKQWSDADPNFRKRAPGFQGVRMLSQDSWEALICFICSSNNNISRISQMAHKLCRHYGQFIANIDDLPFHDFPTPAALTGPQVESHLRSLGFGYRAKYIAETARIVALGRPPHWLDRLRNPANPSFSAPPEAINPDADYKDAHEQLVQLMGVGPKVADCVCLMGLGWGQAVPVDTHVWQIAQRDYKFGGKSKTKTFSKAMYEGVGDLFRGLWGEYAGWAHSVLFTADLKSFAEQGSKAKVNVKIEGLVKVEVEVEEEVDQSVEQGVAAAFKVEAEEEIDEPAAQTRGSRKRIRATKSEVDVEVKIKVEEAEKENLFHTSISETVAKRRQARRGGL